MLFNSIDFAVFLPVVFVIYWLMAKHLRLQNAFLLLASYIFYGWWDWKFLLLIIFSTLIDFSVGRFLENERIHSRRKWILAISLMVNLGILFFFKYFNFFLDSFRSSFSFFGFDIEGESLRVILPVGISFYTFQSLSYTIDVYRGKMKAAKNLIDFAAFLSFFPQLVAGPIERAANLFPQFLRERKFNKLNAVDGLRQMLWGLFKKVVIADNCAIFVNNIFENYHSYSGSTLLLGAIFFSIQIYCDFSGYSDIAIGTARLFDFNLMRNFAFPYFSRDIAEFWRRWHISLSTWFRDYVYIPLGGSHSGTLKKIRNTFIIFLLSGLWHGASWTFVIWGLINAIYFLPLLLSGKNRRNLDIVSAGKILPSPVEFLSVSVTFLLTTLAWVFFRSESLEQAFYFLSEIFSSSLFHFPDTVAFSTGMYHPVFITVIVCIFFIVEWLNRERQHALEQLHVRTPTFLRFGIYYIIIFSIVFISGVQQSFIYFQF